MHIGGTSCNKHSASWWTCPVLPLGFSLRKFQRGWLLREGPAVVQSVYKDLPLDGIWLDMNEISGYCTGDVCIDPGAPSPPSQPAASVPSPDLPSCL